MIDKQIMKFPLVKKVLPLLASLSSLQAIFIIGQAFGLGKGITLLWEGKDLKATLFYLVVFFVSYIFRHACIYIRDQKLHEIASETTKVLRENLLQKIFRMGPKIMQEQGTGNITTMALEGIQQVENYLVLILSKMMNMMLVPFIVLLAIFYLDKTTAFILLLVFPLIILFMIILGYAAQSKANNQYKTFQMLSNHFIDSLRGIDTLKFLGISKNYEKSVYQSSENFRRATMSTLKVAILSTFALDFFTTLSIAVVAVFLGLRLLEGQMLLFPALTVLILAPEYFLPIREFANDYHATLDGKNALTKIQEILAIKEMTLGEQKLLPWQKESVLSVKNISFSYENQMTLNEISFEAKGFQKIGIMGLSGAGKSTLINLLAGFLEPSGGKITYNETSLAHFYEKDWLRQVIYLPQNPYIFQMSVKENVAFYRPDASIKEIEEAIDKVGLTTFINELPEGLDTILGEGARRLSGGQSQRIALARALLDQSRKIILFDEPTAHLDIETELELKEKMLPLMENRLVFFSTHRMHWMKEMDHILVLADGSIKEQGSFEQLKEQGNLFRYFNQVLKGKGQIDGDKN